MTNSGTPKADEEEGGKDDILTDDPFSSAEQVVEFRLKEWQNRYVITPQDQGLMSFTRSEGGLKLPEDLYQSR